MPGRGLSRRPVAVISAFIICVGFWSWITSCGFVNHKGTCYEHVINKYEHARIFTDVLVNVVPPIKGGLVRIKGSFIRQADAFWLLSPCIQTKQTPYS